jgi:hypothetical protein
MSGASKKLMGTTAAGGELLAIEDVFSTYLYEGTGTVRSINNGIDLDGEGGLVWIKKRDASYNHMLFDTERGPNKWIRSDTTNAEESGYTDLLDSFNSNGFTLDDDQSLGGVNYQLAGENQYASWTFRKAPRFFDCVEYTGTGAAQTIAHNLGTTVGTLIVKRTDSTGNWGVFHRSEGPSKYGLLHDNLAFQTDEPNAWNGTAPTDTEFSVGAANATNTSGATYVAYLFAHDPLGPSGDGSDGLIACGSYTGNGSTDGPEIDLGWEPQWVLVKNSTSGGGWVLGDVMRGLSDSSGKYLYADASDAEVSYNWLTPKANGFKLINTGSDANASGDTHIYIAIRRGPMRAPTSGTEVFDVEYHDATVAPAFKSPFPVDFALVRNVTATTSVEAASRLTQGKSLSTASTAAETSDASYLFDYQDGWRNTTGTFTNLYSWMFRRAPGFFDVVAYSGNSVAGRTVPHNLGVAPEMMIVKSRTDANSWYVYTQPTGNTGLLVLNSTTAAITPVSSWNNTSPTDVVFSVDNSSSLNGSGITYIAYLFATLPGVSKVGSFTHTINVDTNVDCGFTSGARFVLIKRTDSTGDWYVFDTARGIESGSDKALFLNNTSAEQTADWLDPSSTGFIVDGPNWSSGTYIFYAIA